MTLCITVLFGETQVPVELIIESVPDEIVARLEIRAQINQRSREAELLAILEEAVHTPVPPGDKRPPPQA
jgi:plasmid stability protein